MESSDKNIDDQETGNQSTDFSFDNKSNINNAQTTGIKALIDHNTLSFDRLPMLEIILDRFTRVLVSDLRSSTSDSISADVHSISSTRFDDYINEVSLDTITCIFKIKELNNVGLIILDRSFIDTMTNILLGGWRSNKPITKGENKPYTDIEKKIAEYMIQLIFENLKSAFSLIKELTFLIQRLELNPRFATIVQPSDIIVLMQIKVDIDKRGGMIEIALPYITLEPISELLKKVFMGDNLADVNMWQNYFTHKINDVEVEIEAVLGQCNILLNELMHLKVGDVLTIDNATSTNDEILVNINGIKAFTGSSGSVNGKMAVKINELLMHETK